MATRRTKEEKLKLIADYEVSGLSMTEWCNANGISTSTFSVQSLMLENLKVNQGL